MDMKIKWFLWIFLILTLAACAQASSTATQPPDETSAPSKPVPSAPSPSTTPEPSGYLAPQESSQAVNPTGYPASSEQIEVEPYPEAQIAVMGPETRFGVPEIDRVLDALFHAPDQFPGLFSYTQVPCTVDGALSSYPVCGKDQADGSLVDVMAVTGPENRFLPKGDPSIIAMQGKVDLLGVFKVVEGYQAAQNFPAGQFGIVLTQKETGATIVLRVTQEGIVRLDFPVQIPGKEQPDLEIYLTPQL
jgi:hypothetical protein